ncbi:MAG TPA: protein translocase subunit SecD [Allosphingosinicella sp.]|jgi:preprotein translocase subunit SecD
MLNFPRWKVWSIGLLCLFAILAALPSVLSPQQAAWLGPLRENHINFGLDLAGGSELLLEAQTGDVARQRVEAMEDTIRTEFRRANLGIDQVSTANNQLTFLISNPAQTADVTRRVRELVQPSAFGGTQEWDLSVDGQRITIRPTSAGLSQAIDQAMDNARAVIDRRINALGTVEPTILRQGENRIVVQVPGLQDPAALQRLIGRTARLEFKMVDETVGPEVLQTGRAPVGRQILPTAEGGRIAVHRRAIITGDMITNAQQGFDQQDNSPNVSLSFDQTGSQRFARVTRENVGKSFAIILDNIVISYPSIRQPILGGTASISGGGFTVETANELAVSLRSGRLPVELTIVQESTVGAELGADSIYWGVVASVVATLAVMIFMLITYGRFGVYAVIGLILNATMILAIMGFFKAALTLPGIAGFVLTIGAAVDANVLINERIREEQRRGRKILDAIESGYREASTAIFDANITNVIAAVLMFYFGTGPIRGFAVVLMIGIVTSVFTAVNITRLLVALWVRRARPKELHI